MSCPHCAELQSAYDDFQAQSKEFEAELENELTEANQQVDVLKAKLEKVSVTLGTIELMHCSVAIASFP